MTFAVFVIVAYYNGQTLNTANAFTALSLISLLSGPMNTLIRTIPMLNASMACLTRIQSFLNSDARRDDRLPLTETTTPSILSSTSDIELDTFSRKDSSLPIMVTQNASFGWTPLGPPAVSDVTFTLSRHDYCFIIGPVGSGKSTLLKGLLGETPSSKGFIYANTPSVAYVDQTPWIQNGTVQQNILGISSFEAPWYSQVVHACALEFDISKLPKGHGRLHSLLQFSILTMSATPVGSAGISLSGGQKQRVALARSVYARKELLILDDIFSGLDADTEEQIFNRLFSTKGLFRQMGTTVILVTHAVHRLPYSNHIISLDSSGHVSEQGPFDSLKSSGGYVQSLATNHKAEDTEPSKQGGAAPTEALFVTEVDDTAVEIDELNRQTGDIAVYKYYFATIGWRQNTIYAVIVVLFAVASKMTEFLVTYCKFSMWHTINNPDLTDSFTRDRRCC